MQSLGILLILGSVLLGRQIVTGRVMSTASDTKEIVLSVLTGDFDKLGSVLSLRGDNVSSDVSGSGTSEEAVTTLLTQPLTGGGTGLLETMIRLGSNAPKGYVWGATGPDAYDCSGLLWAAMKETGVYSGARFTTATFVRTMGDKIKQVQSPSVGDIVLWPGEHIGVVSGLDQFYSAKSPKSGIGYSPIAASGIKGTPVFYRVGM